MGCGASKAVSNSETVKSPLLPSKEDTTALNVPDGAGDAPATMELIAENQSNDNGIRNEERSSPLADIKNEEIPSGRPRFVAFEIPLNDDQKVEHDQLEAIFKRPLPKRLRHLEPLENISHMTSEQLFEKQRLFEERRLKALEKKKEKSLHTSNKVEVVHENSEVSLPSEARNDLSVIMQRQQSARRNREARRQEIQNKQRLRHERAKKVIERAKRMREIEELVDFEIEKYEDGSSPNSDENEDEAWLVAEKAQWSKSSLDEKCSTPPTSGYNSRDISATGSGELVTDGPYLGIDRQANSDEFFDQVKP